ncbi:family 78 glycoside hydrolase catalytic domain [Microbacterium sp. NPDC089180]|uniref:family 78 glycoside hydrolase catalytic domain n=1 Tax=unclassified Microbacterium TaxID=2609290 RepID=UPI0034439545
MAMFFRFVALMRSPVYIRRNLKRFTGRRSPLMKLSLRRIGVLTMAVLLASVTVPGVSPLSGGDVAVAMESSEAPESLTVNQLPSPRDVADLSAPLLGWRVGSARQSAYQVQLALNESDLSRAPVWDSARVESSASTNVAYAGPALTPAEGYVWRVRTWDGDVVSPWSAPSRFGTATDEWTGTTPIWAPNAATWSDYTVEGDFRVEAQNATIVLRARDSSNYLMWQFRGNGANTLAPHTRAGNSFTQLKSVPLGESLINGTTYRFKIIASGNRISTFLNDRKIDETAVPDSYATGYLGFRTGGSERNSWDNLRVTSADGGSLYSDNFDAASADFPCALTVDGRLAVGSGQNCIYSAGSTDWAFFRGDVDIADKDIAWATVYATAASTAPTRQFVYKMWLNGEFVGLGPTQPIARETRYDGFDVTGLLRRGTTNSLGALAYTTTDKRFQSHLVVEYSDGSRETFGTTTDWKTLNGSRVFPAAGSIGTQYFTAPKENINAASYPTGFSEPGFDDSRWTRAEAKNVFSDLEATPTAKVTQQLQLPERIVEKSPGNYFLDYGRTWIGGLSLDLEGVNGQILDLRFGEVLSAPETVRFAMNTGNTYQDKWTLRDGRQQLETWGMRVFRYAEVQGAPTGLTANDFPALAQVYPFDPEGAAFSSSDDNLVKVWELSRHTVDATNHNLYVDSWTRERDAYEADSYLQMMANFYVSDDPTLGNYSLEYLLTGRTWPTEWPMYTILAFHDSYTQTGDTTALARNYNSLKAKLPTRWVEPSTGLIRKNSGSNGANSCTDCDIVDWPGSERDGYVFRPYNTVINAIGHQSYVDMAAIATALGKNDDAAEFTAIAQRLRSAANERLFDTTKGAWRDGLNADGSSIDHFAIQATVFATAFGLADEQRAAQAASYIESRGMACSVYCAAFVLEALYDGDRADVAHAMLTSTGLRSWMNMINKGAGATAEAWDSTLKGNLTYSHPWAASPAYNIPQGMFGIRPTVPGYAAFDVRPQPAAVEWASVRLPTLKGSIGVAHHTHDGRTDIAVHVPGNTVARAFVPGAAEDREPIVYLDGRATPATWERGYLRVDDVPAGCHVLSLEPGTGPRTDERLLDACPDGGPTSPMDETAPIVTGLPDTGSLIPDNQPLKILATDDGYGVRSFTATVDDQVVDATQSIDLKGRRGDVVITARAVDNAGLSTEVTTTVTVFPEEGSKSAPGVGVLSTDQGHTTGLRGGTYSVVMDMWWGSNGGMFRLYENGKLIATDYPSPETPKAQKVSVLVEGKANGTYTYTGELINARGSTATKSLVVQVTNAAPGKAVLSNDNWDGDGAYTVTGDMWWGTNATSYRLLENDVLIDEKSLTSATPAAQKTTTFVTGRAAGSYRYTLILVNAVGETSSETMVVKVK